jgi:outer membrane immunogenic protein
MQRSLLGIAVASILTTGAMTTGAMAADLPVKAPPMAAPVIYNWTGFYIGANGGYSWGRANTSILPLAGSPFPSVPFTAFHQNVDGGLGGGQVGYNWQVDPKWLVGLEADIQGTGERSSTGLTTSTNRYGSSIVGVPVGSGADFNAIATLAANLSYDLQWFATFRGRVGFLATPQTLLYGTGGLAVGQFSYTASSSLSVQVFGPGLAGTTPGIGFTLPVGPAATSSDTRLGWTVGGGIEHKFTPNWSGKLEYLYMDFGTKTYFAGTANQADVSFHDHVLRAGINYEFSAGGPIVARY